MAVVRESTGAVGSYLRLFFEDALESLKVGTAYKSAKRLRGETRLVALGAASWADLDQMDALLTLIAEGVAVPFPVELVVLDEHALRRLLETVPAGYERMKVLFTRPDGIRGTDDAH